MAEFENSIAYGESLLANIRDRNDELRKEEEKKAKKNQWKALAGKVAIGVAEDYMQQRTNNFINAENQVLRTIVLKILLQIILKPLNTNKKQKHTMVV